MFRLRALTAATVGMVQLSRRHHSGAFRSHQRRRVMLAALAGVTGITASAGIMWTRYESKTALSHISTTQLSLFYVLYFVLIKLLPEIIVHLKMSSSVLLAGCTCKNNERLPTGFPNTPAALLKKHQFAVV